MPTIVAYTRSQPPENFYPWFIVSPPSSGSCCFSEMEEIGMIQQEGGWECAYRRCKRCGFTIYMIQRRISAGARLAKIAGTLKRTLRPNHLEW